MPAATDTTTPAKRTRVTRPKPDAVLLAAVDEASEAARATAEHASDVGEHLGATMDADRLASHTFACTMRGYRGWHWTVTVARAPRSKVATICEVELLPGDEAILAPEWLPWSQRLRPGDIGPGDVLPFQADDPRLEPGYVPTGDEEEDRVAIEELALARVRVLSLDGKDEAAQRWHEGTHGPTAPGAIQSAAGCGSCGFLVTLQGTLGQVFGVCANAWSDDDGKIVSLDHGCGAHSETDVAPHPTDWPDADPVIDETTVVPLDLTPAPVAEAVPEIAAAEAAVEAAEPDADATASVEPADVAEPAADAPVPTADAVEPAADTPDDSATEPAPEP